MRERTRFAGFVLAAMLAPLYAAKPGGWRENLSAEEQAALHEALGETLARVGYRSDAEVQPLAV